MDKILNKARDIALSDKDLKNIVNGKASIVLYPNLVHYKTIDDVLGPHKAAFILFCAKPHYGHWVLLFQTSESCLELFNPYGGFPDDSLEYIPKEFREKSNQNHTYLSFLLYNSPYCLEYNEFAFQAKGPDIKTCGRHTAVRLLLRNLSLYEYKELMEKLMNEFNIDMDTLVTLITLNYGKQRKY